MLIIVCPSETAPFLRGTPVYLTPCVGCDDMKQLIHTAHAMLFAARLPPPSYPLRICSRNCLGERPVYCLKYLPKKLCVGKL